MKFLNILFLILLIFSKLSQFSYASSTDSIKDPVIVGLRSHYGFIIPHSVYLRDVAHTKPRGFQFDISRLNTDVDSWMTCHCYARRGLTLSYINFAYPEVLGEAYSALFFVEPLIMDRNRMFLSFRAGLGFTYLTEVYHETTNPTNLFFSTPISFAIHLNLNFNYKINDNLNFVAGGFFNHISNANVRQPNKGMNYPTVTLGIDYIFNPKELEDRSEWQSIELYQKKKRTSFELISTIKTLKGNSEKGFEDKNCFVYGFSSNYSRIVSKFSALNIGAEWIVDGYVKEKVERENLNKDHRRASILMGHDLLLGDFEFTQQLGVYVYAPYETENVFQRYKIIYRINDYFYAGLSLKAYLNVADNLEIRFGVTF